MLYVPFPTSYPSKTEEQNCLERLPAQLPILSLWRTSNPLFPILPVFLSFPPRTSKGFTRSPERALRDLHLKSTCLSRSHQTSIPPTTKQALLRYLGTRCCLYAHAHVRLRYACLMVPSSGCGWPDRRASKAHFNFYMLVLKQLAAVAVPASISTIYPSNDDASVLMPVTRLLEGIRNIFKIAFDVHNSLHDFLTTRFEAIQVGLS